MSTATTQTKSSIAPLSAFCWHELHTRDINGSAAFYASLFGWTVKACGPGAEPAYTEWENNGRIIGGMMGMPPGIPDSVPPHWAVYVNVADVEQATATARTHGGSVVVEPFDIPQVGRMSTVADPTGAFINLYKGTPGNGSIKNVPGEAGHFCWTELVTSDTDAAKRFYAAVVGWTYAEHNFSGSPYTCLVLHGRSAEDRTAMIGGMMKIEPEWGPCPSTWITYISVAALDPVAARVKELGGTWCCEPMTVPGVGRMIVCKDPFGAAFALHGAS